MSEELVLVIPTSVFREVGNFQGLTTAVDRYLPHLLAEQHLTFMPRGAAETDPRFKQIIPYVVLRWQSNLFHYRRGGGAGEKRLRSLRSIGIGGHINPGDDRPGENAYRRALVREVAEEVFLESAYEEQCLGLINDDSTPVGQVHLGIVHVFDLAQSGVHRREADITQDGFAPLGELVEQRDEFESWSRFVLQHLASNSLALAGRGG